MQHLLVLLSTILLFLSACNNNTQVKAAGADSSSDISATDVTDGHPSWIMQGNIYEVNIRQYTPEGTIKAFSAHLQRLKDMGVQTLWFMPVQPISKKDRKGPMGSYYAIADYTAINPEFGTMDDWKELVKQAHNMGFKVIIDWVANHTGADHPWLTKHPDYYETDSATGKPMSPFDWTDVRKLNYKNSQVHDSMLAAMRFWIEQSDIDGFRCDVAAEVPKEFWSRAITDLKKMKNIFMLAEADKPWLHEAGFDASYAWPQFHVMKEIAKGQKPAYALDSLIQMTDTSFPKNAMLMYFTSNHDENSWNKADWGTMPGASHAPFAVLTQTLKSTVPLIYSGQEEPFLDSIRFFYKDTITFGRFERAGFYKTLLNLRKTNEALAANASFQKLPTSNDAALYAFERAKGSQKVLVVVNLSNKPQEFTWKQQPSEKEWNNIFTGIKEPVLNAIEPWGYAVYHK